MERSNTAVLRKCSVREGGVSESGLLFSEKGIRLSAVKADAVSNTEALGKYDTVVG